MVAEFGKLSLEQLIDIVYVEANNIARTNAPNRYKKVVDELIITIFRLDEEQLHMIINEQTYIRTYKFGHSTVTVGHAKTLFVLRTFGARFRHIKVSIYTGYQTTLKQYVDHINEHCKFAHQTIELRYFDFGEQLTFTHAKGVELYFSTVSAAKGLAGYFPNMESLKVDGNQAPPVLGHHFSQLKGVEFASLGYSIDPNIEKLLSSNPQITSLKTTLSRSDALLQYASTHLTQLETLNIDNMDENPHCVRSSGPIRFSGVTHFTVMPSSGDMCWPSVLLLLKNIKVHAVKTFVLVVEEERVPELTDWILESPAIEHLYVLLAKLTAAQMLTFAHALPSMRDLSVSCKNDGFLNELKEVMLANPKSLQRIHVRGEMSLDKYRKILPAGWTVRQKTLGFMSEVTLEKGAGK